MKSRRLLAIALIAAASALLAGGLSTAPVVGRLLEQLELATLDWRVRSTARTPADTLAENPRAAESQVRLVLFDSASVRDWPYLSPFPRAMIADLIEVVSGFGPKAIGLDVYLDRRYPELNALDNGDARLREAIAEAGNVILVAPTEQRGEHRALLPPDPYFAEVAAGVATADLPTTYETIRDAYLTVRTEDGLAPSFALALYAEARGLDLDSLLAAAEHSGTLELPGLPASYARIADDETVQDVPVLFMGPPSVPGRGDGAFTAFAAADLPLAASFAPPGWFRDRIVIIGSGFHESERFRTAFYDAPRPDGDIYGWTYGPEIHANVLENLLLGRFMTPLGTGRTLGLLLLLALAVALVTFTRGVTWGAATGLGLLLATAVLAFLVFDDRYLHVPVIAPTLSLAFAFLGSTSYISIVEGREKRQIRGMFGKYVAPAVVDQLVADPSRFQPGGEKRPITVLFSDLAGFTSLSETLDPADLVALLNRYLDDMSDIVMAEGGTVDKYIGDAVMALYGAPVSFPDHALRACRTAVEMQRRLDALNRDWEAGGRRPLRMRIGINTGTPVVGNIGGERRFDYTALGDAVNLAARLEPACKTYGVGIMISEATRQAAGDAVRVRELEVLAVYGKEEPVRVYELMGMAGDEPGARAELVEHYTRGLEAFRTRDFELAVRYFRAALDVDPDDGPSRLYLERSTHLLTNPPAEDWDFVERRQFK